MNKVLNLILENTIDRAHSLTFNTVLKNWLSTIDLSNIETSSRTIVFNTVRSNPKTFHLYTDLYIGHLLARLGCRVYILLDDGALEHWDTIQRHRITAPVLNPMRSLRARRLRRNVEALWEIFKTSGLELRWYSDFIDNTPVEDIDGDVERYALASALRHFECGVFDPEDQNQQDYFQLSLKNAQTSKTVGHRIVDELRPDTYATSHGIYSTWGPAYSVVKNAGIPTVVYAHHPYHLGGFMLDDAPGGSLDRKALEHYLKITEFTPRQRTVSQAYLDARYSHQTSDTMEYFGNSASAAKILFTDPITQDQRTFGLFPNIAWDAIGDHLAPIYDSVIDWVADTVRAIGADGKHRLIIRFHPAEVTRLKGTISTEGLVRDKVPEIDKYPNIVIVAAKEKVNSYDLLRDIVDVALVYTGTMGAESQPLGVPVVSAASGRFSEQFVHIAGNRAEYLGIIKNPESIISAFNTNRGKIIDSVLKYHFYLSDVLYFPMAIMSNEGRHIASAKELSARDKVDEEGLKKTLRRFLA